MISKMRQEALSAPHLVANQLQTNDALLRTLAQALRDNQPSAIATIARGSSDHAASYFAYLTMLRTGRWVASLPMSLVTMENAPMQAKNLLTVAFSQSGRSPDLITPTQSLRAGGATTVAIVNDLDSPLANAAQVPIGIHAGAEMSVAATKSFIGQLTASAHFVARWTDDNALLDALRALPSQLEIAAQMDWSAAVATLADAKALYVVGRGLGLSTAMEAALKMKETCGLQAEAVSGAEIKHGPMALVDTGYPILIFAPRGPTQAGLVALAKEMRARGASVLLVAPDASALDVAHLSMQSTDSPLLDPVSMIQSFYPMVDALARARGFDPDAPKSLSKVTLTH